MCLCKRETIARRERWMVKKQHNGRTEWNEDGHFENVKRDDDLNE